MKGFAKLVICSALTLGGTQQHQTTSIAPKTNVTMEIIIFNGGYIFKCLFFPSACLVFGRGVVKWFSIMSADSNNLPSGIHCFTGQNLGPLLQVWLLVSYISSPTRLKGALRCKGLPKICHGSIEPWQVLHCVALLLWSGSFTSSPWTGWRYGTKQQNTKGWT